MSKTLDFDHVANAALPETTRACIDVIDRLQNYNPGIQALALAVTFKTLCEVAGASPQDIFTYAGNVMDDREGARRVNFKGVKAYMQGELKL